MRDYVADRSTHDHFGFCGYRAAIACLYARPEGASQDEVNEAAGALGSPQEGYLNMLHQALKWGHGVVQWYHPTRGEISKLKYEPLHKARDAIAPPANYAQMNQSPHGVRPTPLKPRRP
jgi:hypothetical protein